MLRFSPDGQLYVGVYGNVYRIVNHTPQPVLISSDPDYADFVSDLLFDRDGYAYVVKGAGAGQRVASYGPAFSLLNDTLAHAPSWWRNQTRLLFAQDGAGGARSRLLVETFEGRVVAVNPPAVRAPGFVFPALLPITFAGSESTLVSQRFSAQLQMPGGPEVVRWTVVHGALPPGVTLSETTGELAGQTQEAGSYTFSVRGRSGDRYGYARFTISVAPLTFSVEDAVNALLGGPALSPANAQFLDQQGNRNGIYDVGDLRAFLRAQGRLATPSH
jgi:hypothetical protein